MAAIDSAQQLLWHEAVEVERKVHHKSKGTEVSVYNEHGMLFLGWLWHTTKRRQWVFTTTLHKRSFPVGAVFVPVYSEVKGEKDV